MLLFLDSWALLHKRDGAWLLLWCWPIGHLGHLADRRCQLLLELSADSSLISGQWHILAVCVSCSGKLRKLREPTFNGHFRNLNWRYLPYIRPKFQGISPQNMPKNMVLTYLHLLDPGFPIETCCNAGNAENIESAKVVTQGEAGEKG